MTPFRSPYPRPALVTKRPTTISHLPPILVGFSAVLFIAANALLFWLHLGSASWGTYLAVTFASSFMQICCWKVLLGKTRAGRVAAFVAAPVFCALLVPAFAGNGNDPRLHYMEIAVDLWMASFALTMIACLVPPSITSPPPVPEPARPLTNGEGTES